jgi:hypothetical protein
MLVFAASSDFRVELSFRFKTLRTSARDVHVLKIIENGEAWLAGGIR